MAVSTLRPPGLEPDNYCGGHRDISPTASQNSNIPVMAADVFSLTDEELKERLHFIKEIGYGNWGSVWACFTKDTPTREKVAVKLVHREKTPATAARVRSLWNEMKIRRAFKDDSHPSVVRFHSFVITPSFALITMEYLPKLIPVEVREAKARPWFQSLLGGVHFLHTHGVTHNDIKPANILLSQASIPVLVDFGFAEKTSLDPSVIPRRKSPGPFLSNLAYGTPEYLPPERARGLLHDTRLSDIYSLGITFFEILVGRTPFEFPGEVETAGDLCTEDQLEAYYERTKKGRWLGEEEWRPRLSIDVENLIRGMTDPIPERRTGTQELLDSYYWLEEHERLFVPVQESAPKTPRPSVNSSAPVFTVTAATPQSKRTATESVLKTSFAPLPRSGSPPATKVRPSAASSRVVTGKPGLKPKSTPSSCIHPPRGSRAAIPRAWKENGKENVNKTYSSATGKKVPTRKPIPAAMALKDSTLSSNAIAARSSTISSAQKKALQDKENVKRRNSRVLVDLTGVNGVTASKKKTDIKPTSMLRVDPIKRDPSPKPVLQVVREMKASMMAAKTQRERDLDQKDYETSGAEDHDIAAELFPIEVLQRSRNESTPVSTFIKNSMDKLGKMSTAVVGGNKRASRQSMFEPRDSLDESVASPVPAKGRRESTPIPALTEETPECDPVVEEVNRMDRLTTWIRDVEKVVEQSRSSFQKPVEAHSPPSLLPAPPPSSPASMSLSASTSRRVTGIKPRLSADITQAETVKRRRATVGGPFSLTDGPIFEAFAANDTTTATIGTDLKPSALDRSPTKAKSQGALNIGISGKLRAISPIARLQMQLDEDLQALQSPPNPQRLSAVIDPAALAAEMNKNDRSVPTFLAPSCLALDDTSKDIPTIEISRTSNSFDLSPPSSPLIVKSKSLDHGRKNRASSGMPTATSIDVLSNITVPTIVNSSGSNLATRSELGASRLVNASNSKEVEGVYDRFLMATSSVVRLGRGYQSDYSIRRTAAHQLRPEEKNPSPSKDNSKIKKALFRGPSVKALTPKTNKAEPTATKSHDDFGIRKLGIKRSGLTKSGAENIPVAEGTTVKGRVKKAFQAILANPSGRSPKTVNRMAH